MNMMLRWKDPRLAFGPEKEMHHTHEMLKGLPIDKITFQRIWLPEVFFVNEQKARVHDLTTPNRRAWLYPDGHVQYEQRISLKLQCAMYLVFFPMDTQLLMLQIQSYGLTTNDLNLVWDNTRSQVEYSKKIELAEFIIDKDEAVKTGRCDKKFVTGIHSCIQVKFKVKREVGFYLFQIYTPSLLIVSLSWFTFWIDPQNSPARVGVGIFVFVNLSFIQANENSALPQVSYMKALDLWFFVCELYAFLALVEYAIVNVFLRRPDLNKKAYNFMLKNQHRFTSQDTLDMPLKMRDKKSRKSLYFFKAKTRKNTIITTEYDDHSSDSDLKIPKSFQDSHSLLKYYRILAISSLLKI